MPFDPRAYGPAVAELLESAPCNQLGPGTPEVSKRRTLAKLDAQSLVAPHGVRDREMTRCCLAGLWLRFDFLDESHGISQNIAGNSGSYWHGIMHRREPDFSNSKYWFRRVHEHPIFDELAAEARRLAGESDVPPEAAYLAEQSEWDPYRFVDLCQAAGARRPALGTLCMNIQQREWELLFDFCYRRAAEGRAG